MSRSNTPSTPNTGAVVDPPRVGRPPMIDAETILEAALEIGLERVTFKQVADHLGVAASTLYRHVRNREELVRLAASKQVLTRRMPLCGDESAPQHWADVAVHHAESLFESFVSEPQLITEYMKGRLGPDVEADFIEQFLALVCPHGFTPAQGIDLYRAIGMLTLGGAIGALASAAAAHAGSPQHVAARRMLAARDPGELPLLRQAAQEYGSLNPQTWRQALNDLISGIAQSRGEKLPPPGNTGGKRRSKQPRTVSRRKKNP